MQKAIVITGATGSGKSKFAIALARKYNGVIINADAMQIYKQAPILSAQPDINDKSQVQHLLYGFVDIFEDKRYSVGKYLTDLDATLKNLKEKTPIIVGGSMMYIEAILNGIDEIPEIEEQTRQQILKNLQNKTAKQLFEILAKIDEKYAKIVDKNNTQRLLRGIEVKLATGKSIVDFWKKNSNKKSGLLQKYQLERLITEISRDKLYDNINKRFDDMIKNGAIDEAKMIYNECKEKNKDIKSIPKIIGLKEFFDYFESKVSLETAIENAKQSTRHYAKRQLTWFRNRFEDFTKISPNCTNIDLF